MADTVADVLLRLGVDTAGLRRGFQDARNQSVRFAADLAQSFALRGGPLFLVNQLATGTGGGGGFFSAIFRGLGGLFGAIGGLFTRTARRIARQVQALFGEIVSRFNLGAASLGETIQRLEEERARAIARLSGKKGGRKELDKLLPQFDQALAELQARQAAIFERFDESLELLRVDEPVRDVAASVQEIVRQFRTYIDAGGDLAKANEFLARSFEQLRKDSARELAEGEEQAIEDALRLNQLLLERGEILSESSEDERRILTRGVLERQRTVAQGKAAELEAVRRRRDERLAQLDQDIAVLRLKVDSEAKVFDLARDRVALETRLLELKAQDFERDAARLAALREIVAGTLPVTGGLIAPVPVLQQQLNLGGVQIVVGSGATPGQAQQAGEQVIESMLRALVRERARFGFAL